MAIRNTRGNFDANYIMTSISGNIDIRQSIDHTLPSQNEVEILLKDRIDRQLLVTQRGRRVDPPMRSEASAAKRRRTDQEVDDAYMQEVAQAEATQTNRKEKGKKVTTAASWPRDPRKDLVDAGKEKWQKQQ